MIATDHKRKNYTETSLISFIDAVLVKYIFRIEIWKLIKIGKSWNFIQLSSYEREYTVQLRWNVNSLLQSIHYYNHPIKKQFFYVNLGTYDNGSIIRVVLWPSWWFSNNFDFVITKNKEKEVYFLRCLVNVAKELLCGDVNLLLITWHESSCPDHSKSWRSFDDEKEIKDLFTRGVF